MLHLIDWLPRAHHAAAALALVMSGAGVLPAVEPELRSLADVRDRPNEDNEPPRYLWPDRVMPPRPGIQEGPFLVLSATPRVNPREIVPQVAEANAAYVKMAGLWCDAPLADLERLDHRAVLIHNAADLRDAPPPGVYSDFDGTLHMVLPADGREDPLLEHVLRTELIRHVLVATGQSAALSPEMTIELASFMASQGSSESAFDPFAAESKPHAEFTAREEMNPSVALQFSWEGDDAALAPQLKAALRSAINHREARPLEALLADAERRAARQDWLAKPLAGQPRIENEGELSPELALRQREMALILKLARRFPPLRSPSFSARVTVYETGEVELAASPSGSPRTLEELYQQVTATADWATLDIDGRVLFGGNLARLQELFAIGEGRYQFVEREGQVYLVSEWVDGQTILATLAEDENQPQRPLVNFSIEDAQ